MGSNEKVQFDCINYSSRVLENVHFSRVTAVFQWIHCTRLLHLIQDLQCKATYQALVEMLLVPARRKSQDLKLYLYRNIKVCAPLNKIKSSNHSHGLSTAIESVDEYAGVAAANKDDSSAIA
jgi:hypothetical protein